MKLSELKALAEKATPGPWYEDGQHWTGQDWAQYTMYASPRQRLLEFNSNKRQNAEFIAAANPQTILQLIARIEGLNEALKFYAGLADDSEWDGCKFLAFDEFGGLSAEIAGPYVANEALDKFGMEVDLK